MPEKWESVAAEVNEAIRSVSDTSQPNGYPATIRRVTSTANPYDPASGSTTITYTRVYVVESSIMKKDRDGTLTGTVRRTLLVAAGDIVPDKADKVRVGESLTYADEATDATIDWQEIDDVKSVSPAGVDVMYEILLAG